MSDLEWLVSDIADILARIADTLEKLCKARLSNEDEQSESFT